jgi:aspartate aminotransferase-like enzyme
MTLVQTTTTTREQRMLIPVPQVESRTTIPAQNMRIPGPTPVPPAVLAELARPVINHRGPKFAAILRRVTARLQYVFQTTSPVLTFPASGTGGQECAIVNLFSPGEHVVAITIGHFGNRFTQIAERFGLQVSRIAFPWGEAADPAIVETRLHELAPYRGVLLTHNETSTGVTNDLQALAALIRQHNPDALIVVDAVSSLSCIPLEMDAWEIDVAFTASQKGLMCPPGLMMLAAGPRAWDANAQASLPRFYFDWARARRSLERGQHPVTPPVSLFYALDLALEMMLAEGLEAIFVRHQRMGDYVRRHVRMIGLHLLADSTHASNTVTAMRVPEGIDAKVLLNTLRERDQVVLAGGQEQLSGKILRIGHMGCCEVRDLFTAPPLPPGAPQGVWFPCEYTQDWRNNSMLALQTREENIPRILITEPIAQEGIDLLRYELPEAHIDVRLDLSPEHLRELIGSYTALIIRSQTSVTSELLAKATRLEVVGRAGSGLDNIDLDAAVRHGVLVVNAPRGSAIAVAEHTLALMLTLCIASPKSDSMLFEKHPLCVSVSHFQPAHSCTAFPRQQDRKQL